MGDVTRHLRRHRRGARTVVYIHPLHNFAIVVLRSAAHRHDAGECRDARRRASSAPGEPVWVVGLGGDSQMHARSTEIASVDPLALPLSRTLRFRDSNLEAMQLVNPPGDFDGVLADEKGDVLGTWSSFAFENGASSRRTSRGVPIDLVADMIDARARAAVRCTRSRPSSIVQPLAGARQIGLSEEWAKRLDAAQPTAPPGAQRRAPGRRLAGRRAAAAGRSAAGASTARSSPASARWSGPWRQAARAGHRVARQARADARRERRWR